MSVISATSFAKIDPIKGQSFLMRFMGGATVTGDGSGGFAQMLVTLPGPALERPLWALTDINVWASTTAAGDATLQISSNDGIASGFDDIFFLDLAALPAALTGAGMAMKQDVGPRRWSAFLHRYNSNASAGVYPYVSVFFVNTNLIVYYLNIKGYFIAEQYLPQAISVFNIN